MATPTILEGLPTTASIEERLEAIGDHAPFDAQQVAAKNGFEGKASAQMEAIALQERGSEAWRHDYLGYIDTWYLQAI